MPIRPDLRPLYPSHWRKLSDRVRFKHAAGRCQVCRRPHLARVRCLPNGQWFDQASSFWRDHGGRPAQTPDLVELIGIRVTRVVLAAAHLDNNPRNNRLQNLRALCQRCHLLHDRSYHLRQRWVTSRRRWAVGDLFEGPYWALVPNDASSRRFQAARSRPARAGTIAGPVVPGRQPTSLDRPHYPITSNLAPAATPHRAGQPDRPRSAPIPLEHLLVPASRPRPA